ncbi:VP2 [Inachis io cypovirus 2]|uniref:VP2 n=1 Tax=Inachis io cypovirus 2 TaxID=1382295 RepID=W6EW49_9REOV|nr:VP2 [Inachis io cypovirus 2]AHJ14792.1 VP2 [Inachis io cypovirus 2]
MTEFSRREAQSLILALSSGDAYTDPKLREIIKWYTTQQRINDALPNIFRNNTFSQNANDRLREIMSNIPLIPIHYFMNGREYESLKTQIPDNRDVDCSTILIKLTLSYRDIMSEVIEANDDSGEFIIRFGRKSNAITDIGKYSMKLKINNTIQSEEDINTAISLTLTKDNEKLCHVDGVVSVLDMIQWTCLVEASSTDRLGPWIPSGHDLRDLQSVTTTTLIKVHNRLTIANNNLSKDEYKKCSFIDSTHSNIMSYTDRYLDGARVLLSSVFDENPFDIGLMMPDYITLNTTEDASRFTTLLDSHLDKLRYELEYAMTVSQMDYYNALFIEELEALAEDAENESAYLAAMTINNTSTLAKLLESVAQYVPFEFEVRGIKAICQSGLSPITCVSDNNLSLQFSSMNDGDQRNSYISDTHPSVQPNFVNNYLTTCNFNDIGNNTLQTFHQIFMNEDLIVFADITSTRVIHNENLSGNVWAETQNLYMPRFIHNGPTDSFYRRIISQATGTQMRFINIIIGGKIVPKVRKWEYGQTLNRIIICSRNSTSLPIDVTLSLTGDFGLYGRTVSFARSTGDILTGDFDTVNHGRLPSIFVQVNQTLTVTSEEGGHMHFYLDTDVLPQSHHINTAIKRTFTNTTPFTENFPDYSAAVNGTFSIGFEANTTNIRMSMTHDDVDAMSCVNTTPRVTSVLGVNLISDVLSPPTDRQNYIAMLRSVIAIDFTLGWRVEIPPGELGLRTMASEFLTNLEQITLSLQSDLQELQYQFENLEARLTNLELQFEALIDAMTPSVWDQILGMIVGIIEGLLPMAAGAVVGLMFQALSRNSGQMLRILRNALGGSKTAIPLTNTMKGSSMGQHSLAAAMTMVDGVLRGRNTTRERLVGSGDHTYRTRPILQNIDGASKYDSLMHVFTNDNRVGSASNGSIRLDLLPELNVHNHNSKPLPVLETYYRPLATLPSPLGNLAHKLTNVNRLRTKFSSNQVSVSCRKPSHAFSVLNNYEVVSATQYKQQVTYIGIGELNPSGRSTGDLGAGIGGITIDYNINMKMNHKGVPTYVKELAPWTSSQYTSEQVSNLYKTLFGKQHPVGMDTSAQWRAISNGIYTKVHTSDLVDKFVVPNKYAGQSIREMAYNPPDFKYNLLNRNCQTFVTDLRNYLANGTLSNRWDTRAHDRLMRGQTIAITNDISSSDTFLAMLT